MSLSDSQYRRFAWLALGAATVLALYSLGTVMTPFFLAAVLAYVCQPLVFWLGKYRLPRPLAVLAVMLLQFALLILVLLTVVPLFVKEISLLLDELPAFFDWLNKALAPWILERTGIPVSFDVASVRSLIAGSLRGTEGLGMKLLDSVRMGGLGLIGFVANVILVPVVQFYIMRDWETIVGRAASMVPRPWEEATVSVIREADQALGQYLHGQVLVILVMSFFYTFGLWLTGLNFFFPIGIITGILVFVPYVGAATGFVLGTLAALMQFHEWTGMLWVWLVFALGQGIEGNFVTPKLVGERIGLHPIAVIFALLAFGQVFGFSGLLIALPASAVLLVALRRIRTAYVASSFYSGK